MLENQSAQLTFPLRDRLSDTMLMTLLSNLVGFRAALSSLKFRAVYWHHLRDFLLLLCGTFARVSQCIRFRFDTQRGIATSAEDILTRVRGEYESISETTK